MKTLSLSWSKRIVAVCAAIIVIGALPHSAQATSVFDLSKRKQVASTIMPVLPPEQLIAGIQGTISRETANHLSDRCLSRIPNRFTSEALQYYCACTSAATMGTMKMSELYELQDKKSWKVGNKSFEKYITNVVSPCIDVPIEDMEYESCILYRGNDWRVKNFPQYCQCVSRAVRGHVKELGTSEIMTEWGRPGVVYDTPLDALWENPTYNQYKNQFRTQCIGNSMAKSPYDTNR